MALPECPNCGSDDVRTVAAAYVGGTSQVRATSAYIGAKGNHGVVVTGGQTQTLLAKGLRPPRKKEWSVVVWLFIWGVVAVIVLGIALANDMNYDRVDEMLLPILAAGILLLGTISALVDYKRTREYNETVYAQELRLWEHSCVCDRCLTVFTISTDENDIAPRRLSTPPREPPPVLKGDALPSLPSSMLEIGDVLILATSGDSDAQSELGQRYFLGTHGANKDHAQAAKWCKLAAEKGKAQAQGILGMLYLWGDGVASDEVEALKWIKEAAEQQCAPAELTLGTCYEEGRGVTQNHIDARKWYRRAAEHGSPEGYTSLAELYELGKGGDIDLWEAKKLYAKALEDGDDSATHKAARTEFKIGVTFLNGDGVQKDINKGLQHVRFAAEKNDTNAQYCLGSMCYEREQTKPEDQGNWSEALRWLRLAAQNGHVGAQAKIAGMYLTGKGVSANGAEAAKWLRRAAEQGCADALTVLGKIYYEGFPDLPRDETEAFKAFKQAAEAGIVSCYGVVGTWYHDGIGIPKNDGEAVRWYRKAAEAGSAGNQFNMGNMYYHGKGVQQSFAEALKWYKLAAQQEFAAAETALAEMYRDGIGVETDVHEAFEWFERAAKHGDEEAKQELRKLATKAPSYRVAQRNL